MRGLLAIVLVSASCGGAGGLATRPTPIPRPDRTHAGIPWFEDRADDALAAARAEGKLVVVDLWASWCMPCLQMRARIMTAAQLGDRADAFVWLALDTEREANAAALARFPSRGLPTFYVVDPADGAIRAHLLGMAPVGSFRRFLDDGRQVDALAKRGAADDPRALLGVADAALAKDDVDAAIAAFRLALERGGPTWDRARFARRGLASALGERGQPEACLDVIEPDLGGRDAEGYETAMVQAGCMWGLAEGHARKARAATAMISALAPLCDGDDDAVAPDDRATACRYLWEGHVIGGDAAGARAAAERRLVHLDRAVVADTVADRRVDDWPRVDTLIFLDRHDQAIAQMTAREAELPDDGNAPAYLARAYADLERWDDALAAIDRAIARSPGPKGVRYLADRADLALEAGRPDLARAAIATARARWSALPEPMRSKGAKAQLDELETKLAAPPTVAPTPATR